MSLVFDVKDIQVDGLPDTSFSTSGVVSLDVLVANPVTTFDIEVPNTAASLDVAVPGPQGPAGLQNVYVRETDPSKDAQGNTIWGIAQTNYVWIKP